jgi:hypothetical protein
MLYRWRRSRWIFKASMRSWWPCSGFMSLPRRQFGSWPILSSHDRDLSLTRRLSRPRNGARQQSFCGRVCWFTLGIPLENQPDPGSTSMVLRSKLNLPGGNIRTELVVHLQQQAPCTASWSWSPHHSSDLHDGRAHNFGKYPALQLEQLAEFTKSALPHPGTQANVNGCSGDRPCSRSPAMRFARLLA